MFLYYLVIKFQHKPTNKLNFHRCSGITDEAGEPKTKKEILIFCSIRKKEKKILGNFLKSKEKTEKYFVFGFVNSSIVSPKC